MGSDKRGYEHLAQAFHDEGVRTNFALMGDANMHWTIALDALEGVETVHVRHEHCACGMAIGYTNATGEVGVASVTLGPGYTQTMTALATAVRARIPMVLFAGDTPVNPENPKWANQGLEQAPLALAVGARHIAPHSAGQLLPAVQEAFYVARTQRLPVVLGVPFDLQKQLHTLPPHVPSTLLLPQKQNFAPAPDIVAQVVALIKAAKHPVIIAGRGAVAAKAGPAIQLLAERIGALVSNTLPARGMFDADEFSLGIAGGFANGAARHEFAQSDLVIAVGASLTSYTLDGGDLFPNAFTVQIDIEPTGRRDGMQIGHLHIKADALAGINALLAAFEPMEAPTSRARTRDVAARIRDLSVDRRQFQPVTDTVDPRDIIAELDELLPKDLDIVSGTGHCAYFHSQMQDRAPEKYHVIREFGAIGNGISISMGVAIAREPGRVVLIDGDGSLLMHIQELETISRHGIKMLICVLNDGAYGAEVHKLRAEGIAEDSAVFGRTDLAAVARSFGLRAATVTALGQIEELFAEYESGTQSALWNIHISDQVVAPLMQKIMDKGLR